jgi:hypothetical protein
MALAKECGHQFFVVVFAHCKLVWFREKKGGRKKKEKRKREGDGFRGVEERAY